ncbi:MAG: hypothetical protein E7158_03295 [Firmicutes bacterium]|nr:hypothetical protein [Bacillota bacterium]
MNKDLPKVYANKIDKELNNDQKVFYSSTSYKNDIRSINKKINDIFSSPNFVYKKNVRIITTNGTINKTIVGINNNNLLTMDNEVISISDIKDIDIN